MNINELDLDDVKQLVKSVNFLQ